MERITMAEAFDRVDEIAEVLKDHGRIIFPTDTIYGIGSHAESEEGLLAVRSLKERWGKPFSIIAPSKRWIVERFDLNGHEQWLEKLPGPFTLVFTPRMPFPEQLSPMGTVGVRIPDHPIRSLVAQFGFPIVATSVNRAGFEPLSSFEQFSEPGYERFCEVRFAIEDGVKDASASTVIDLTGTRPVYVRM